MSQKPFQYLISRSNPFLRSTPPLDRKAQLALFEDWSLFYQLYCKARESGLSHAASIKSLDSSIVAKGKYAQHRLITSNVRLVLSYVNRLFPDSPIKDDLLAEGLLGLSYALLRFDSKQNIKFSSYAFFWVRQKVLSASATHSKYKSRFLSTDRLPEIEAPSAIWEALSDQEKFISASDSPLLACLSLHGDWDQYLQIQQNIQDKIKLQEGSHG